MNGIETVYKAITFRSRLEARWAVFFDALGWDWVYEPFDADGYIPDFLINGENPILVEVKPAPTCLDLTVHVKRLEEALRNWTHDVLLVGTSPFIWADGFRCAGILLENELQYFYPHVWSSRNAAFAAGHAIWHQCNACNQVSVHHDKCSYASRPCGHFDGDHYLGGLQRDLERVWRDTVDATRWRHR
jgi:hypothetical protein